MIEKILSHLGLPTEPPKAYPARDLADREGNCHEQNVIFESLAER